MTPVNPEILAALSAGIKAEVAAYVFYTTALKLPAAAKFSDVLERMAYEEKEHFHILERQHDSLIRSEKWISTADIMKEEGLPDIPEDMLASHQALITEVQNASSAQAVLDIAYRLEEEAFETYSREVGRADSMEGRQVFTQLSKFEQGHMNLVRSLMEQYA